MSVGYKDDPIFLPSKEEYKKYKNKIPLCKECWWLRSQGYCSGLSVFVFTNSSVIKYGTGVFDDRISVRPALKLLNETSSNIEIGGVKFVKIDKGLYISDEPILNNTKEINFGSHTI